LMDREVVFEDMLLNGRRLGFFRVLAAMGVEAAYEVRGKRFGDALGRIRVKGKAQRALDELPREIPHLIDEVPALVAVALFAEGTTKIPGLAELRIKESDRLARLVDLAEAFGGRATIDGDTLIIEGSARPPKAVTVRTDGDHRIAMAAHVIARAKDVALTLDVPGCERTSFPDFLTVLHEVPRTA